MPGISMETGRRKNCRPPPQHYTAGYTALHYTAGYTALPPPCLEQRCPWEGRPARVAISGHSQLPAKICSLSSHATTNTLGTNEIKEAW